MVQKYADWRGSVLNRRRSMMVAGYVPETQRERLKVCEILAKYMAGHSADAYTDLSESHRKWWVDSALVYQLASLQADLVTLGMRASGVDPEQAKKTNDALRLCGWFRACRRIERECMGYGDAVVVPEWDAVANVPRLEVYMPGMWLPIDDRNAVLFWERKERDGEVFVQHYMMGKMATMEPDGKRARVDGAASAGLKEGWVKKEQPGRNDLPLQDRLPGDTFEPLPFSTLPVVAVHNGDVDIDGFGMSDFWPVLGLIDSYNEILTDERIAARFIVPTTTMWGDAPPRDKNNRPITEYEPGGMYYVGQNGGMTQGDTSTMLTAANAQRVQLFAGTIAGIRMCKAMVGDVGETSGRRDREVRLMYMPGKNKISAVREDRAPVWLRLRTLLDELWSEKDPAGYKAATGGVPLASVGLELDDILPEDVGERVNQVTAARGSGIMDRATGAAVVAKAMGVSTDPALMARLAEEEVKAAGMGFL